jgi:hypothetical protein
MRKKNKMRKRNRNIHLEHIPNNCVDKNACKRDEKIKNNDGRNK